MMKEARTHIPEGVTRVINTTTGEIKMVKRHVKEIALSNGFKLKEQPDGEMDLNPYVYQFADALCNQQSARIAELEKALKDIAAVIDGDLRVTAIDILNGIVHPKEINADADRIELIIYKAFEHQTQQQIKSQLVCDGLPTFYISEAGMVCTHRLSEGDTPVWCRTGDDGLKAMNAISARAICEQEDL